MITALSLIIVTSVQLAYEPEVVINRDNEKILDTFKITRQRSSWTKSNLSEKCIHNTSAKLYILVQSPKVNKKVRQAIRDTWAYRNSPDVRIKFALTKSPSRLNDQDSFIHRHLKRFYHHCVPGDYLLITNDLYFINTPQIITAINQRLPQRHTTICAKANHHVENEAKYLGQCDVHMPILFAKDTVYELLDSNLRNSSASSSIRFGEHLYLTPNETMRIINGTIDGSNLLFFFSGRLRNAADISQLWMASRDYRTIES